MKIQLTMILLVLLQGSVQAQFFSQKSAQLRRLAEQVVALKAYGEVLWKGYKTANKGLGIIRDIKNGDFKLHDLFFQELEKVNPNIRRYAPAAKMVVLQVETIRTASKAVKLIRADRGYGEEDLLFLERLLEHIVANGKRILEEFSTIYRDGALKLTDDERVVRIDKLYTQMLDNYRDAQDVATELALSNMNKTHAGEEIARSRRLYLINR
ncbi:hypothetical protein ABIE26_002948 [Pedobacter africanus]|uniref:hypothetical protein n=1 Tax=Pedobacter africanus TaxID=151894 RepID=UPI003398E14D